MSEEIKIKISQPMFEVGELERFDSNIHSIVEDYSKMMFKEKDQILTQRIIMKQEEEIKELQDQLQQKENIIKEVREKTKENQEYLESAKEMYLEQDDELLKIHTVQLINNNLSQNDDILEILDKGE